jgi:hypothetical protein
MKDSFLTIPGVFALTIEAENSEILVFENISIENLQLNFSNLKTTDSSDPTADINGSTYYWLKFQSCKFDVFYIANSNKSIEFKRTNIQFMDFSANNLARLWIHESTIVHFQTSFNRIRYLRVVDSRSVYFALLGDILDNFELLDSRFGYDSPYPLTSDSLILWYGGPKKLEVDRDSTTLFNTSSNNVSFDFADIYADEIIFERNTFYASYSPIMHLKGECEYFQFSGNQVGMAVVLPLRVNAGFSMTGGNHFTKTISFDDTSLPSTPANKVSINWNELKGKMASTIFATSDSALFYVGVNKMELSRTKEFTDLIMAYQKLYNVFKSQGDIEQANAAYIEMKDIYLRRLKYTYQNQGGTTNFFKLKLAQLLKVYTEHGTNPGQAMTASVWIILFFAVIYFFFPSEWDKESKIKLIKHFNEFRKKNNKGYFGPFVQMMKGLVLSMVNAVTLSINAFVTLGFGVIPTSGTAKYICIFQGFLGWFLLSIFIVSLINQVMF